ncbi:CLUMA_CG010344, isoform A [Clunio marinus]|uniref:CLUMA_CG010344, isoform A n=1 Tax=Clunio marinus TaxID=568069 RepID=A0A1J1IDH0_9DIPT|nr:CLUMA_CG010344, isoform A [Clunio marinus]
MNHQYWLIKNAKKLQRKFNAKEDENIVASDNELDAKLELFKSISESTANLSNIVDKYRDGLQLLAVETSSLGNFLRDCGKNSSSSESLMCNTGKVVCYLGAQHTSATTSLNRTLSELNTFKRAVNDTKETIAAMEKERTEYRSALTLMKICSTDVDPDSGRGLEKFRTSQKYVKYAKQNFDKYSLACLQKIDLLAAARCNLFSYSLAAYQTNWLTLNEKNREVLEAHVKIIDKEPRKHNFGILKELGQEAEEVAEKALEEGDKKDLNQELNDDDQRLFFGNEFSDCGPSTEKKNEDNQTSSEDNNSKTTNNDKLIDYEKDFDEFMSSSNLLLPSQLLMDDSLLNNIQSGDSNLNLLGSLNPLHAASNMDLLSSSDSKENSVQLNKNPSKKANDVSKWFSLFSELDPLNQQSEQDNANKNLHAA